MALTLVPKRHRHHARFRGMGQDTTIDTTATGGYSSPDLAATLSAQAGLPVSPLSGPLPPVSAPSALDQSLPTIISQGFKTLQLALTPSGSYLIQQPGGGYVISNQVPGAVPGALNIGSSVAGNFNIGSVLLWGGLILGVVFVAKAIGGK